MFKILITNIFFYFFFLFGGGGAQTNEHFWGYEDFVDIFGVIAKLDLSMHSMVFS